MVWSSKSEIEKVLAARVAITKVFKKCRRDDVSNGAVSIANTSHTGGSANEPGLHKVTISQEIRVGNC